MTPSRRRLAAAAWIGVPFVLYLLLLRHFWFDAPLWDDYDAMLHRVVEMRQAPSLAEWLRLLFVQHNEHRIALARLASWSMSLLGPLDFRLLVAIANLAWLGILVLFWAEFRDRVALPLFAAAAMLTLQMSYYEASLLSMGAFSNIGAMFLALACLYFAQRDGAGNAAAALACGMLAVGAVASGLFALPIAAVVCALRGRRIRAAVFAGVALSLWCVYFIGYTRPVGHPSLLAGLSHPVDAAALFVLIVGGVYPNRWLAVVVTLCVAAALAWAFRRRLWKLSPTATSWIAFIAVNVAATTAGRVGFGVFHSSRYAINSTCLAVIALLALAALHGPWSRRMIAAALATSILVSVSISAASWGAASDLAFRARLLARAVPAEPGVRTDPYFGVMYPDRDRANALLEESRSHGLWRAREQTVWPTQVRLAGTSPAGDTVRAGFVDHVAVDGARLRIGGWSHIPATVQGRVFTLISPSLPVETAVRLVDRLDVAAELRLPYLVYSGFELQARYASEDEARRAAAGVCLLAQAPGSDIRVLNGSPGCPTAVAR